MPNEIVIITPEHVELRFQIAGPGSRLLALLIDQFLLLVFSILMFLLLISLSVISTDFGRTFYNSLGIFIIIYSFTPILYFFLFETFQEGRTPGKKILRLRVIRDSGHTLDMRAALIRNLLRIIDSLPGFYLIGSIAVFFSGQNRRIGDYVGGTLVVQDPKYVTENNNKQSIQENLSIADESAQMFTLPEPILMRIDQITKTEYRAIRHLIDRAPELDNKVLFSNANRLIGLICDKMELDITEIPNPLLFLKALANEWEQRKLQ